MTLDEYAGRVAALEQAVTVEDIDAALSGLPEDASVVPTASHHRWLVAALGGIEQRGRWRLSKRMWIVALLGGAKLDLGTAEVEAPDSVITVFVALGGVDILAPPGVAIQLSGLSLFGGKSDKRPEAATSGITADPCARLRNLWRRGRKGTKQHLKRSRHSAR